MKTIKRNRNIVATTLALGLGLAATGAQAMTGIHDPLPTGEKGNAPIFSGETNSFDEANLFVRIGGRPFIVAMPGRDK